MNIENYISDINEIYSRGNVTEHSYRGILSNFIENSFSKIKATNEPARMKCGAPDYVISRGEIPIGYIEAKDIGIDLESIESSEQINRYVKGLDNFILTNYLEFYFYRYGERVETVQIAKIKNKQFILFPKNYSLFQNLFNAFIKFKGKTIKSSEELAVMMAHKAQLMKETFYKTLVTEDKSKNTSLRDQLNAFRKILIHDLDEKRFADIYAQTIAYGLFAARFNMDHNSKDIFNRKTASYYVPKSNPFLRKLFNYIAGPELDERVTWVVDDLADIFKHVDTDHLLKSFDPDKSKEDPMIHFYETFLAKYDPAIRKKRGVYYTPDTVVKFIVRAVDDILKTEFKLSKGLANTSKVKIKTKNNEEKTIEKEVHKVQILDPATGTGTFLAEIINQIHSNFKGQQGVWNNYVEEHLKPRLHGFEILMASYAICHLKLDLLFKNTGYTHPSNGGHRFNVYLTNSLEEVYDSKIGPIGFIEWLTQEAEEANKIKDSSPVMVVIGNPPYSISSMNRGKWIQGKIEDYKRKLYEKKINLDDDYIKFIRLAEYFIEKNKQGILAMITNNSFYDGVTHRQMRKHLLETFDKIYVFDLHGNSKKKEKSPDGSKDENVFDIQQGVGISLMIKYPQTLKKPAEVWHKDLYGLRENKYKELAESKLHPLKWKKLKLKEPYYFFVPKDFKNRSEYENGFKVTELFDNYNSGIQTKRDKLTIQFDDFSWKEIKNNFSDLKEAVIRSKYDLPPDGRDWTISNAKDDLTKNKTTTMNILYRPFDIRRTIFTGKTKGFIAYPRTKTMIHFIDRKNIGLMTSRSFPQNQKFDRVFLSNIICDLHSASDQTYFFPLYLYEENSDEENSNQMELYEKVNGIRKPNFKEKQVTLIEEKLNLKLVIESKQKGKKNFSPVDLLDYIYAVLHSPTYRKKYQEFLRIDFPRIPYPKDQKTFWVLAKLGSALRKFHLLESPGLEKAITKYPIEGENHVEKVYYETQSNLKGKVYINGNQYFENVPLISWEFYIGGYQPAQKWLKDRKGRKLSFDDITHYQKIIIALKKTHELMQEIDKIKFF